MKRYLWLIFAGAGLLLWGLTHLYEFFFAPLPFWPYLALIGGSLLLLLAGVILGLIQAFTRKKPEPTPWWNKTF